MKKTISILLLTTIIFSLSACGKSNKVIEVENLISKIGEVTIENKENIEAAQAAYNNLSTFSKNKVSNSSTLETATKKLKELLKEEALSVLTSKYDKIADITLYESIYQPTDLYARSYVLPFIKESSNNISLKLRYLYTGTDSIYYENIIIFVDGIRYHISPEYGTVTWDHENFKTVEWIDYTATEQDIKMLNEIAKSTEAIVRFQGEKDYYDLTIEEYDKVAIKDILNAYEVLSDN